MFIVMCEDLPKQLLWEVHTILLLLLMIIQEKFGCFGHISEIEENDRDSDLSKGQKTSLRQ